MKQKEFGLYGIFGFPAAHSLSPAMQEAAFEASGLKAFYLALELKPRDFKSVMRAIRSLALDGFNITVPYKQAVMTSLDALTPEAKAIGAVNTVFRKANKWWGANTDAYGFWASLVHEGRFRPKGKKALLFGAGGAARAVAYALASSGARTIWITNRGPFAARRKKIIRDFKSRFPKTRFVDFSLHEEEKLKAALNEAELAVNATSAASEKLMTDRAIPKASGRKKLFFDLIYYRGSNTPFLVSARKKGHRTLSGLGMLLFQGAKAFELWTGKKAPLGVMRRALVAGLKERT